MNEKYVSPVINELKWLSIKITALIAIIASVFVLGAVAAKVWI
jgi:hypothetical protein